MDNLDSPRSSSTSNGTSGYASSYGERYVPLDLLLPLRNIPYLPSSIQEAGWFFHPRYFIEGEDGTQHVYCWSLYPCAGGAMHCLWRVYRGNQFQLVRHIEPCGSDPFGVGGYLFDAVAPEERGVWREVKPSGPFTPLRAPVTLYRELQPEWFGLNDSTPEHNPQTLQAPSDPLCRATDIFPWGPSNLHINPASICSAAPTPSSHYSDASTDISVVTNDSYLDDSKAEDNTWSSREFESLYTDGDGHIVLVVPTSLKTRKNIGHFLGQALRDLGKRTREVKCSACMEKHKNKPEKANKLWDVKPSNLERHISSHLAVKEFYCPICQVKFTTKHQMKIHKGKYHSGEPANTPDGGNGEVTNGHEDPSPVTTGFPVELGPLEADHTNHSGGQYMVPFDANFGYELKSKFI